MGKVITVVIEIGDNGLPIVTTTINECNCNEVQPPQQADCEQSEWDKIGNDYGLDGETQTPCQMKAIIEGFTTEKIIALVKRIFYAKNIDPETCESAYEPLYEQHLADANASGDIRAFNLAYALETVKLITGNDLSGC